MATNDRSDELARELAILMRRSGSLTREIAGQVDARLDAVTYTTLARIRDAGPIRAADLVDYFSIDKAAISRQLRSLEDFGLIVREADPSDGRARQVRLSPTGERSLRKIQADRSTRFRQLIDGWSDHDIDELTRLLHLLNSKVYDV
jgi:DNA-binding MarR family transcriptional regulator